MAYSNFCKVKTFKENAKSFQYTENFYGKELGIEITVSDYLVWGGFPILNGIDKIMIRVQ